MSGETASGEATTAATTDDLFLGDRLRMLQPLRGYRAGLDAVVLAAACPGDAARPGEVLDVGAGVGVAGLAVAARLAGARVTLVEHDGAMAALARLNIARNRLDGRARVVEADITARRTLDARLALGRECYDTIIANPPYHDTARGRPASDPARRAAHAMPAGALDGWARFMAGMARPGGRLVMIHRAEATGAIIAALSGRFGALSLLPLHPRAGAPAVRILVGGTKGSRAPLRLLPGIVLHGDDGRFVPEIDRVLRGPERLPVDLFG